MAVLPAGFALPPGPYLVALVVGVGVIGGTLWRLTPPVTGDTVIGLVPWMAVGSVLHAWYVLGAAPRTVAPLFGVPAVYATVFVGLGAVWAGATVRLGDQPRGVATWLGLAGTAAFVSALAAVLATESTVALLWPVVGVIVAAVVAGATWRLLERTVPAAAATGWPGVLVVFAHTLDGVSTAIGVDVLGFGERTPLSRAVLEIAGGLPTADLLGVGWLFVVVKLVVAGAVVGLFADLVEETPRQGYLLLAVVAAVGLGPGIHNLLLYALAA